ncbi:thermonuclease family protein [Falsibacillus albus]|uniref:Endonuclease n=1 Tax=Falsibacillus albus TaxID=2478915 RepID=A0A3L7JV90_9BACI|nr:endonuclease [Falsibacillus albus]
MGCAPEASQENDAPIKKEATSETTKKDDTASQTATNGSSNKKADTSGSVSSQKTASNQVPVTLVQTVDGDTIKVNYKGKVETVRYLLVDTPEEKKPGTCVQLYAMDAYNRNKQLVNSGKLTLEFEASSDRDKYGRLLAYVFVDGKSVQDTLVKEGYARVAYIYDPPYKYLAQYQSDEAKAKAQKLHIWSKSGFATDRGFNGCAASTTKAKASTPSKTTAPKTSTTTSHPATTQPSAPASSGGTEIFANCTELRKKYPHGVPEGHPVYQAKMDRDKDGYACER